MVVIDSSLARGASQGGATFHAGDGPYGMTLGAKRVVAVDITGLPVAAVVVPASMSEAAATGCLLADMNALAIAYRLQVTKVDQGMKEVEAVKLSKQAGVKVERVFWPKKPKLKRVAKQDAQAHQEQEEARRFKPLPYTWRVEVAHGRIGRSRRLAKSFENTTRSASAWLQVACVDLLLQDLTDPAKVQPRPRRVPVAAGT
jgi:putative transposase